MPTRATLSFSLRPAPGADIDELFAEAEQRVRAAAAPHAIEWTLVKASPPFATRDLAAFAPLLGERLRSAVDLGFWTEAARFSEHGIDAVVFGPGDVGQAHAADEFVTHRRSRDRAGHVRDGARLMEAEIVQRFLESVGAKADIDLYLKLFRSQRKESFAILAPNAQIVKSALDPVHFDLRILAGLGLLPVVLLGLFEPKDADAQATRVSDWLLEDAVPCEIIRADAELGPATVEAIRAVIARGAIPLVSVEAARGADHRRALPAARRAGDGARDAQGGVPQPPRRAWWSAPASRRRWSAWRPTPSGCWRPAALSRGQALLLRQIKRLLEQVPQLDGRHRRQPAAVPARALHRQRRRHADPPRLAHRRARRAGRRSTRRGCARCSPRPSAATIRDDFFTRPIARTFVEESYRGAAVVAETRGRRPT